MPAAEIMVDRKLKVFAFDPSFARRLSTRSMNELIVSIPAAMELKTPTGSFAGPVGEYLEVVDVDPASGVFYAPVDLDAPHLLASGGLEPDESDPQFHQQMVYAVAMTTIGNFEQALGRVALWAPRVSRDENGRYKSESYVARIRIYPHALREANAYYSPQKKALLFGYFEADGRGANTVPGGTVFTCLSHDVIAHETTHALLDGLHPRFAEDTNPDALALHEAFADIVALFQHFSYPLVLIDQIGRTRGNLRSENLLGQLAQEFGVALGRGGALRDAIGVMGEDGMWRPREPDRLALQKAKGPHARGSILVAAIFHAFLSIYEARTQDLFRIASQGTGILPPGELHPDLVARLAEAAAKSARHILEICIRALDYCPPVGVTFGDYLRAIITGDHDLYPDDEKGYRVAILQGFLAWGIVPQGMRTVTNRTLLWPTLDEAAADQDTRERGYDLETEFGVLISDASRIRDGLQQRADVSSDIIVHLDRYAQKIADIMKSDLKKSIVSNQRSVTKLRSLESVEQKYKISDAGFSTESVIARNLLDSGFGENRELIWNVQRFYRQLFWGLLTDPQHYPLLKTLRVSIDRLAPATVFRGNSTGLPAIEVNSVRMAKRRGVRGQVEREYVVELSQRRRGYFDADTQQRKDNGPPLGSDEKFDFRFRRGCTLLIDAANFRIRRVIRTQGDICDDVELERLRRFLVTKKSQPSDAFHSATKASENEAFAHLHRDFIGETSPWPD